jgi:hypothetical protein
MDSTSGTLHPGAQVTRSFCFWPDFVPAPEQLDEEVMNRFGDFLEAHVEPGPGSMRSDGLSGIHGDRT